MEADVRLDRPVASRRGWRAAMLALARNPVGSIYGTILADSVLAVEARYQLLLRDLIYAELVTVVVYWLAHVYAEFLGAPPTVNRRAGLRRLADTMAHEWSLVTASFVPLLAVLLAAAAGASVHTAALAGMWTGVAALVLWGEIAGRHSGRGAWTSLAYGLVSGMFGIALVLLRALLH
ncbi:hypothetical protein I6A84_39855 [Frankia sp. CNm7]|uniref:Uncharacterized protein n=1 Tax=Frankia nepalensis TaxID=1836974 RepID=A0A937UUW5_9ACTN|nr:hypothetical protein [Frankia nepalensis]MBL7495945.1 hypothetical protein [Frankia nepalensis]MBL7513582.1 hypothetical protein [Frankia nepalensis]MBL7524036.1 hypothetical protein [Frankia nepalensis]MBL7632670.1 hypothetical protein [Frankia nepalensis]